jgi:hypothetical protein
MGTAGAVHFVVRALDWVKGSCSSRVPDRRRDEELSRILG